VLQFAQRSAAAYRGLQQDDTDEPDRSRVHSGAAIGGGRLSDNHHLDDSVELMHGNMGELTWDVKERERSGMGKPSENPPRSMSAVRVAIVVGTRESRAPGEEPQLVSGLKVRPCRMMVTHGNPCGCHQEGHEGKGTDRRPPCAVKAACTVTTGG